MNLLCVLRVLSKKVPKQLQMYVRTHMGFRLNENTLTNRLLCYLDQDANKLSSNAVQSEMQALFDTIRKNERKTNLHKLSVWEIENLLLSISKSTEFRQVFVYLDWECSLRVNSLNFADIFRMLNSFARIVPNLIVRSEFYKKAMRKLDDDLNFLSAQDLVNFCFYIGLQKKNEGSQKMFKRCFRRINFMQLSVEELCVVCNTAFKTSTKITNKEFLSCIVNVINNNLFLLKDPALFVSFIKTIRHNRFQSEDLLSTITCTIFFNHTIDYYAFPTLVHILALYADCLWYDENILTLFVERAARLIKNTKVTRKPASISEKIRGKDLNRLLWAVSNLGYEIDPKLLSEVIVPNILARIEVGEYAKTIDMLMETILYLWILDYQATELLPLALTRMNLEHIKALPTKTKQRIDVLLNFIQCENRLLYRRLNLKPLNPPHFNIETQTQMRPLLRRVHDALQNVSVKLDLKFRYTHEIPHLNLLGLTGFRKNVYKTVYVEVLDDFVRVKNTEGVFGLMRVKLRVLEKREEVLLVVDKKVLEAMSDRELQDYLENELALLN